MKEEKKTEEIKKESATDKKIRKIKEKNAKLAVAVIVGLLIIGVLLLMAITKNMQRLKNRNNIQNEIYNRQITNFNKNNNNSNNSGRHTRVHTIAPDKPIIYLYPEQETEIEVKLGNPEKISCSYPKYDNSWKVKASPNGDLIDLKTGTNLYALYWEGKEYEKTEVKEGFVVKGENTAQFLEEKLEILGLNDKERNEFIIYWLPKLEKNKYNLIRFQTQEEIEEYMPLKITPKPDTVIRVMMEYKGLEKPIEIQEQKLQTPKRTGYVAVEWGGTEGM